MRSKIEINDVLLRKALKASGLVSKRTVIEEGLRLLLKVKGQGGIRRLREKVSLASNVREAGKGEKS